MKLRLLLPFVVLACLDFCGPHAPAQGARRGQTTQHTGGQGVSLCTPDQVSLGTDDEHGNFDGMSHSGTLLVVRNLGSNACRMATLPQIKLYNKSTLMNVRFSSVTSAASAFVLVAAGAELTSGLRWVSGDVYDGGVCVTATSLHLQIAGRDLSTETSYQLCGEKGKPIGAEMYPLAPDPVYQPGKAATPGS